MTAAATNENAGSASAASNAAESVGMYVLKRDGRREEVKWDKITARIARLAYGLNAARVSPTIVAQKVIAGVYAGVCTSQLDELAAETAAAMASSHPDYGILAARIAVSNLHKATTKSFAETVRLLATAKDNTTGRALRLVSDELVSIVEKHGERIDSAIVYDRDFDYDYFGFKTLERSYLMRVNKHVVERPQHMFMRVALGIHGEDIESAIETYEYMSRKLFIHASPTLFHAGTPRPQMSSCFLVDMAEDSIVGIYDTLKQCAVISKYAGGIGVAVHKIRATGSHIAGTNGTSNGLIPMLRLFNDTGRYVDQGGGKRRGAIAVYLEPWHADIFEFLDLRKNSGAEEMRCRDLFLGLWVSDIFMKRVEANGKWSLFCPHEAPGLHEVWGEEHERLYERYESEGRARRTVNAQELWFKILDAQIETGVPYILYKDASNSKLNQQNLGTIQCSNLCTEIIEYSSPEETAVCNLGSLALPKFVDVAARRFDYERLAEATRVLTRNLNKVIDRNFYPTKEAERSNFRHRPIGLGVQGLADVFQMLGLPFDAPESMEINRRIFETLYFASLDASCELAAKLGPYATYEGSPVSRGILQQDMWGVSSDPELGLDWAGLRARIAQHGVRNSLLVAPMPTASTSQILGNNETVEAYTSNIYVRRVLAGEFVVVNTHLIAALEARGLWNAEIKQRIIAANGSVQHVPGFPEDLKPIFRTAWEIKQKAIIDMAVDRGAWIDQSQSLNVFMSEPTTSKLTSYHFYAWKRGSKCSSYYLRSRAAADPIKFSVDVGTLKEAKRAKEAAEHASETAPVLACRRDNPDCISCSG